MKVYNCKNESCLKYLIGGIALCKVISKGAEASLDISDGSYATDDGIPITGDAFCFHCGAKARKITFEPGSDNPENVCKMIDDLDAEIEAVMKSLEGK